DRAEADPRGRRPPGQHHRAGQGLAPEFDPPPRLAIGPSAVTAWEGALKLRGAARVPAEGFESKYLRYGSAQILGPHDLMLAGRPARRRVGVHHGLLRAGAAAGCEF